MACTSTGLQNKRRDAEYDQQQWRPPPAHAVHTPTPRQTFIVACSTRFRFQIVCNCSESSMASPLNGASPLPSSSPSTAPASTTPNRVASVAGTNKRPRGLAGSGKAKKAAAAAVAGTGAEVAATTQLSQLHSTGAGVNLPLAGTTSSSNNISSSSDTGGSGSSTNQPRDAVAMQTILHSMGVHSYEPRVLNQLLEFMQREIVEVLQDANDYQEHRGAAKLELSDIRLATQNRLSYCFTQPPPREVLLSLAAEKNRTPIPVVPSRVGVILPPTVYTVLNPNFHVDKQSTIHSGAAGSGTGTGNGATTSAITTAATTGLVPLDVELRQQQQQPQPFQQSPQPAVQFQSLQPQQQPFFVQQQTLS